MSPVTFFGELESPDAGAARERLVWLQHTGQQLERYTFFDWAGGAPLIVRAYPGPSGVLSRIRLVRVDPAAPSQRFSGNGLVPRLSGRASQITPAACGALVSRDGGVREASLEVELPAGLVKLTAQLGSPAELSLESLSGRPLALATLPAEGSSSDPLRLEVQVVSFGERARLTARSPADFTVRAVSFEPVSDASQLSPQLRAAQRPSPWPTRGTAIVDSTPEGMLPGSRMRTTLSAVAGLGARSVRMPFDPMKEYRRSRALGPNDPIADPEDFWRYYEAVSIPSVADAVAFAGSQGLKVELLLLPVVTSGPTDGRIWVNPRLTPDMSRAVRRLTGSLASLRTPGNARVSSFIWGYDFWNEAVDATVAGNTLPPEWLTLARNLLQVLREAEAAQGVAPAQGSFFLLDLGVLPWPSYGWLYESLERHLLPDARVVYTDHFYEPYGFTHQPICPDVGVYPQGPLQYPGPADGSLWNAQVLSTLMAAKGRFSNSTGAPFYVGEFSASQFAPVNAAGRPSQDAWLADVIAAMRAAGLAWSYFSYGTYYAWDPLLAPQTPPCGPYTYVSPAQSTTMQLLEAAFRAP